MAKQGYTLREALVHLKACRPIAEPNLGFVVQLKAFEISLFGKSSEVPLNLMKLFDPEGFEAL